LQDERDRENRPVGVLGHKGEVVDPNAKIGLHGNFENDLIHAGRIVLERCYSRHSSADEPSCLVATREKE
jgi:hypothetical protein